MDLSNDLVSQFAKITNDNRDKNKETTVYGTVTIYDGKTCVKIDGSDLLTPVDTTTEVKDGERVAVLIKNHSAVIIGNTSDPSAGVSTTDVMSSQIGNLETSNQETSSKVSTMEQSLDSFVVELGEVSNTAEQTSTKLSTVEQTVNSYEVRISDVETTNGTLTQDVASLKLTNEEFEVKIEKKTDKSSIISTINASPESVTISSDKVNITGLVHFSDLTTEGSTEINGANITTGYISCDRLQGGTLSAADEINFVGGARIFGNQGEHGAGLTISASGYTLSGASQSYMYGNWSLQNGDFEVTSGIECATLNVTDSATFKTLTASDAITATGAITGSNIKINTGDIYLGTIGSTVTSSYIKMGTGGYMSAYSGFHFIDSAGNPHVLRAGTMYTSGTVVTSDKRKKMDIRYVNSDSQSFGESGLLSPNTNISTRDMYEFINELPLTSFRYIDEVNNNRDFTHYGFITQDIMYTKVGSELVAMLDENKRIGDEDDYTGYCQEKLIAFIIGALQEEIKARKALEEYVKNINTK